MVINNVLSFIYILHKFLFNVTLRLNIYIFIIIVKKVNNIDHTTSSKQISPSESVTKPKLENKRRNIKKNTYKKKRICHKETIISIFFSLSLIVF